MNVEGVMMLTNDEDDDGEDDGELDDPFYREVIFVEKTDKGVITHIEEHVEVLQGFYDALVEAKKQNVRIIWASFRDTPFFEYAQSVVDLGAERICRQAELEEKVPPIRQLADVVKKLDAFFKLNVH